jgi:hypothetical protein
MLKKEREEGRKGKDSNARIINAIDAFKNCGLMPRQANRKNKNKGARWE